MSFLVSIRQSSSIASFWRLLRLSLRRQECSKLARIVASAAKNAPIRVEECPYEEGSTNHKAWLTRMKRQGKV